jgi:hypothetical protein
LDSSNFSLKQIDDVNVPTAPNATRFSVTELEVFQYVLQQKMKWKGHRLSWTEFASHWTRVARVAKLRDPFAEVYLRTASQLEDKWKSSEKAKYSQ